MVGIADLCEYEQTTVDKVAYKFRKKCFIKQSVIKNMRQLKKYKAATNLMKLAKKNSR